MLYTHTHTGKKYEREKMGNALISKLVLWDAVSGTELIQKAAWGKKQIYSK